jgi:hypothetical protein
LPVANVPQEVEVIEAQHDQPAVAQEGGEFEAQHVATQEETVQWMHDLLQEMANEAEVEDIHMIEDVADVDVLMEIVELDRQGKPQETIREGARMMVLPVDLR